MFKFKIGDRFINTDSSNRWNYQKVGTVVGFHAHGQSMYVKYDDDTYGMSSSGSDYKKINPCKCCNCTCEKD